MCTALLTSVFFQGLIQDLIITPDPGSAYEICEVYCPDCEFALPFGAVYSASSSSATFFNASSSSSSSSSASSSSSSASGSGSAAGGSLSRVCEMLVYLCRRGVADWVGRAEKETAEGRAGISVCLPQEGGVCMCVLCVCVCVCVCCPVRMGPRERESDLIYVYLS